MARLRGRSRRGERLVASVPHGHWSTTTFVAGLRLDRIDAPMVLDGPMDGQSFLDYVEQVLVPTLRAGDIVVMDNLSSHNSQAVREAIEALGAQLLLLPPYSPDFNPIEQAFANPGSSPGQSPAAQSRCAHPRRTLGRHRRSAQALHRARLRQLLR